MKEFIVWDDFAKEFYDNKNSFYENDSNNKCVLLNGRVEIFVDEEYDSSVFYPYKEKDKLIPLWDIGLKDTNRKSIYADCSIVEMYRGLDSFVGYYTYNKNKAHYEFIILHGCDNDSFGNIIGGSLKIIDTIQENKLGLIK